MAEQVEMCLRPTQARSAASSTLSRLALEGTAGREEVVHREIDRLIDIYLYLSPRVS